MTSDEANDVEVPGMEWMGFDVGYYESESLHFSVVLNEVVCGTVVELVGFAKRLNANLLFSSREDAEELMRVRESLIGSGADLETGDEVIAVASILAVIRSTPAAAS